MSLLHSGSRPSGQAPSAPFPMERAQVPVSLAKGRGGRVDVSSASPGVARAGHRGSPWAVEACPC